MPSPLFLSLNGDTSRGRKPLRLGPELAEVLGEKLSDVGVKGGLLETTSLEHAERVAKLMTSLTRLRHQVKPSRRSKLSGKLMWKVCVDSSALNYLVTTKLYIVVALRWPLDFLRGIIDGDGSISAYIDKKGYLVPGLRVYLNEEVDFDLALFLKRFIEGEFGVHVSVKREGGMIVLRMQSWKAVELLAEVRPAIESKRRAVEELVKLVRLPPRDRVREWLKA